jgi:hypothetical protein
MGRLAGKVAVVIGAGQSPGRGVPRPAGAQALLVEEGKSWRPLVTSLGVTIE